MQGMVSGGNLTHGRTEQYHYHIYLFQEMKKQVDDGPGNPAKRESKEDPYSSRSSHLVSLLHIDMLL